MDRKLTKTEVTEIVDKETGEIIIEGTKSISFLIDTSSYPNGIYIVKVVSHNENNSIATKKIIVKH